MALLNLPDGTAQSALIHAADVSVAIISFDLRGQKIITLVVKGNAVFIPWSEGNEAALISAGVSVVHAPTTLAMKLKKA